MSTIHLQLIQRSQTLQAGDTITLRFPLDATSPERDLTIGGDIAPLLTAAESDYYLPDPLREPARLPLIGQTLYRWLDGDDRYLTRAIDAQRGKTKAVALLLEQGAGLDHLPWELLHDGTAYLVQQSPTAVIPVRWQPGNLPDTPFYTSAQNRPLHVVLMATAPQGVQPPLDFEGEEARIMAATQRQPLRLSVEESGNLRELGYLLGDLGEGAVDVVHLTGHATHTNTGPRFLCEDELGAAHLASAQALAEGLTHTPRLLFLSGCRTGQAMRRGEIASLAAALVATGIPAVLGWGQPVFDPDATLAAATLYGALAQGQPLVRALAESYGTMLQRHAANPSECRHWHLLRLYARGRLDEVSPVTQPLVTAPRTPGRLRLTIPQRDQDHLDDEGRVPVAKRADFVGRRRVLQAALRALRPDGEALGVILYGLGGHGKSTLAHRLRQRWLQRSEAHTAVVLYGKLDEESLLRKLNNGLRSQSAREQLNGRDSLRFRLRAALETCDEQLLIILDNFEDNFEQGGGLPKLIDGRPLLTGATVQLLEDLGFALHASRERGQAHRLLLTSRYRPTWRGADAFFTCQLDKLNDEAVQKKVTRLALAGTAPVAADQRTLCQRAITIADGNPRLLEWLFDLLDQRGATTPDLDAVLSQMAGAESALREDILAAALLAAQTPALRQLLARGLVCELPVPEPVFAALAALDPALPNRTTEQQRASDLGLLETTNNPITNYLRVPRILAPLLVDETPPDRATLAATAAQALYTSWWAPDDAAPSEAQLLEIHRLALLGGASAIATELANTLAGRWNRADQYRYREVIDLVTRTVAQTANARLWNQIGYAKRQLGEMQEAISHYQAAVAICADDEHGLRGTFLNNLGGVYSDLGEIEKSLELMQQAATIRHEIGAAWEEVISQWWLGVLYQKLGNRAAALKALDRGITLATVLGHPNLPQLQALRNQIDPDGIDK